MASTPSGLKAEFAWPGGDRPGDKGFRYEPPPPVVLAIQQALAARFQPVREPGVRYRALCSPDGPVGRYRLATRAGTWFVRVSSRTGSPELEKSITDHLISRGVEVNPLLVAGSILHWQGRIFRVDVRPMIQGRHFNGSRGDLIKLATTLAACHRALSDFPLAREVRAAAAIRNQRLEHVRSLMRDALERGKFEFFAERAAWASAHRQWLLEMVEGFDPRLDRRPDAQCVHGEIHPGNVLFRAGDGAAVLVDFEESVHVFAPAAWDLAFLVQRFCLGDQPSASVARERLAVVVEAYGRPLDDLPPIMRQAAWFSIATIVDLRVFRGVVTPAAECDKFVRLECQARAFGDAR